MLVVDEIGAEYERLIAAGAPILAPVETEEWGKRYFQVEDPKGLIVQLVRWVAAYPTRSRPSRSGRASRVEDARGSSSMARTQTRRLGLYVVRALVACGASVVVADVDEGAWRPREDGSLAFCRADMGMAAAIELVV